MNGLFEAARELDAFMSDQAWDWCLIGGLAVQVWGEPRTTMDIDITLLTGIGEESRYITVMLENFSPRIADAAGFAEANRILLLRSSNGKDIDIALGALPFEALMVSRSRRIEFAPGLLLPCCTAEDLIVMKAFAARPRDWLDVETVIARHAALDTAYILSQLAELCGLIDNPEILSRVQALLAASS